MKLTWQHIVLVVVLLGAVVIARVVENAEDRTLVLIVTAVLAAFLGPSAVNSTQNDKLDHIETATKQVQHQTNSVLDARIRQAVRDELDVHPGLRDDNGNRKGTSDANH